MLGQCLAQPLVAISWEFLLWSRVVSILGFLGAEGVRGSLNLNLWVSWGVVEGISISRFLDLGGELGISIAILGFGSGGWGGGRNLNLGVVGCVANSPGANSPGSNSPTRRLFRELFVDYFEHATAWGAARAC